MLTPGEEYANLFDVHTDHLKPKGNLSPGLICMGSPFQSSMTLSSTEADSSAWSGAVSATSTSCVQITAWLNVMSYNACTTIYGHYSSSAFQVYFGVIARAGERRSRAGNAKCISGSSACSLNIQIRTSA